MADMGYFPPIPDVRPTIYAYEYDGSSDYEGYTKIGYTGHDVEEHIRAVERKSIFGHRVLGSWSAMKNDGTYVTENDVINVLLAKGIKQYNTEDDGKMWFDCTAEEIGKIVEGLKDGTEHVHEERKQYSLRPEQEIAIKRASRYFQTSEDSPRRFLWHTQQHFDKALCAYILCRTIKLQRVLILSFSTTEDPDWHDRLQEYSHFENWQLISEKEVRDNNMTLDEAFENADKDNPIIVYGSFHDLLETNGHGGIKVKNGFIHDNEWDIIIFDNYHFGSWRENESELLKDVEDDFDPEQYKFEEADNTYKEDFLPIKTEYYLYISTMPFYSLNTGDFEREQVYNWTYFDEQKAKDEWPNLSSFPTYRPEHFGVNLYKPFPRVVLLTFSLPEDILKITDQKVSDDVDFDRFFSAEGNKENAVFRYEKNVQKWLDYIRGAYIQNSSESPGIQRKPHIPYGDKKILNTLLHSLWLLPDEASCYAMKNLLENPQNEFYQDYKILCEGTSEDADDIESIKEAMGNPLETKTITLTCSRITAAPALKPWSGIFMLRNIKSPETYFHTAFRIQQPWTAYDEFRQRHLLKQECYIFDFSPARALRLIADYSSQFSVFENSPDRRVNRFANSMPVLAYDGIATRRLNTADILAQIPASQVAQRWKSAMLVNADNNTLRKLSKNTMTLEEISQNEGLGNIMSDITSILSAYDEAKNIRTKEEDLTAEEKENLKQSEEEYKHKRKMLYKKLLRFTARIPLFLYLTDKNKGSLDEVMDQSDPVFFREVTGLRIESFRKLISLNVFNEQLLHDAVYKFGRYEEKNLDYTGITRHHIEEAGTRITYASEEDEISTDTVTMTAAEVAAMIASIKTTSKKKPRTTSSTPRKKKKTTEEIVSDYTSKYGGLGTAGSVVPQEAKTEIPLPQIKIGMKVSHRKYGIGRIVDIDADQKYFFVSFALGDKKFQYPNAITLHFVDIIE